MLLSSGLKLTPYKEEKRGCITKQNGVKFFHYLEQSSRDNHGY